DEESKASTSGTNGFLAGLLSDTTCPSAGPHSADHSSSAVHYELVQDLVTGKNEICVKLL
ncbi:unnamed protein product, partial [Amoebophrya sp. A120]